MAAGAPLPSPHSSRLASSVAKPWDEMVPAMPRAATTRPTRSTGARPNRSANGPHSTWPRAFPTMYTVIMRVIRFDPGPRPTSGLISSKAGSEASTPKATITLMKARKATTDASERWGGIGRVCPSAPAHRTTGPPLDSRYGAARE